MIRHWLARMFPAACAVIALVILGWPAPAQARLAARIAAKAGGPTQAPTQAPVQKAYYSPVQQGMCEPPCITYKSHRFLHCKFDRCNTQSVVLYVTDPCTGCTTAVPVCIPCCCDGQPEVCSRVGLFGRDVIEYHWCCGFDIKVVFGKCGDISVHSYGL